MLNFICDTTSSPGIDIKDAELMRKLASSEKHIIDATDAVQLLLRTNAIVDMTCQIGMSHYHVW